MTKWIEATEVEIKERGIVRETFWDILPKPGFHFHTTKVGPTTLVAQTNDATDEAIFCNNIATADAEPGASSSTSLGLNIDSTKMDGLRSRGGKGRS